MELPDIQNTKPEIQIALNRVGITDLQLPIYILQKDNKIQHSVAKISCFVDLESNLKGINMSRIPIALHKYLDSPISGKLIQSISENIRLNSNAKMCQLIYSFPYFIQKISPISKEPGLVIYPIKFNVTQSEDFSIFEVSIIATTTSLCPCSKEISEYGAHNQKCAIEITCQMDIDNFVWIEDIISIAETSASCEIFSVLKRIDEKYVTEQAYLNPCFVEDITRNCYEKLLTLKDIKKFKIEVTSDESIHNHKAYAQLKI
jgi:GTP cyclohydrolase I